MTKRKRRKIPAALKAKICIEAIREEKTVSELAAEYEVHPNLISKWKKEFLARSCEIFEKDAPDKALEKEQSGLYEQIGKLKVQNDWLKKKLGLLDLI